jgi:hypothetical protein
MNTGTALDLAPRPVHALFASLCVLADSLLAELRAVIADLRSDRDHWREQAQRLSVLAITDQRKEPEPKPEPEPVSWWRWLRSTGTTG